MAGARKMEDPSWRMLRSMGTDLMASLGKFPGSYLRAAKERKELQVEMYEQECVAALAEERLEEGASELSDLLCREAVEAADKLSAAHEALRAVLRASPADQPGRLRAAVQAVQELSASCESFEATLECLQALGVKMESAQTALSVMREGLSLAELHMRQLGSRTRPTAHRQGGS